MTNLLAGVINWGMGAKIILLSVASVALLVAVILFIMTLFGRKNRGAAQHPTERRTEGGKSNISITVSERKEVSAPSGEPQDSVRRDIP